MYHKYIKRFFDIILSLCCIIVSSPILLVTALLVRIKLGSPVIFKQERPGYHNEIFTLYKFRSMTDAVMRMVICCQTKNVFQDLDRC